MVHSPSPVCPLVTRTALYSSPLQELVRWGISALQALALSGGATDPGVAWVTVLAIGDYPCHSHDDIVEKTWHLHPAFLVLSGFKQPSHDGSSITPPASLGEGSMRSILHGACS